MKRWVFIVLSCFCGVVFAAPQKFVVMLDWFPNPNQGPLFVAKQEGYFLEEGLDVELVAPSNPLDPPKLVAAGTADLAIDYKPRYLVERAHHLPLVQVGTLINRPLDAVAALKSHGIHKPEDLKGKRVGRLGFGSGNMLLRSILEPRGIKVDDLELIYLRFDLAQALLTEQTDAVVGVSRNYEPIQLKMAGKDIILFFPEDNGVPQYAEEIYVVQEKNKNNPAVKAFLRALKRSTAYLKQHPEEAWKAFSSDYPAANNDLNHKSWQITVPMFDDHPADTHLAQCRTFAKYHHQFVPEVNPGLC